MTQHKQGGRRAGAGAKPIFKKPMVRVNVTLDERTIAFAKSLLISNQPPQPV